MNFKDYLALDRLSASGLKAIKKSPAFFKWNKENPQSETEAMRIGKAVHSAILTPDLFKEEYTCAPKCDKRTKIGKEMFEAFQLANQGKEILTEEDHNQCVAIANSVLSSPKIKNMLSKGESEKTFLNEIDGVEMKARLDFVTPKFILDIKTTKNAEKSAFSKDFVNLGYDLQFGLYQEMVRLETGNTLPVIILAVEKEANLDYSVFQVPQTLLDCGLRKAKVLIAQYKQCKETGVWNGYSKDVEELEIPSWYKIEE